jgi:hypothetical protein
MENPRIELDYSVCETKYLPCNFPKLFRAFDATHHHARKTLTQKKRCVFGLGLLDTEGIEPSHQLYKN